MKTLSTIFLAIVFFTSAQAHKEKFGLNLTAGQTYYQKSSSQMTIIQTINNQLLNIEMTINGNMSFKVTDIQNSLYNMEVRYESLTMKMNLPNGITEFSSDKNDDNDIMSTMLGCMIGRPFLVKMTKTGKITEVKNIEYVFSTMFDKFPQLSDFQKQQIKEQLLKAYGEKAFIGNLEMNTAIYPDSPVSLGDKWKIKIIMESGMKATIETIYELRENTDAYAVFYGSSTMETADKEAYIETNGMPLKYDLTGTMTSVIKTDKVTGWVMEAKLSQAFKGTAYIRDNPKLPGGMSIPMSINNEMSITDN